MKRQMHGQGLDAACTPKDECSHVTFRCPLVESFLTPLTMGGDSCGGDISERCRHDVGLEPDATLLVLRRLLFRLWDPFPP